MSSNNRQLSKFRPPSIKGAALLARTRLKQLLARVDGKEFQVAQIEAQAGQGKTISVAQYLDSIESPRCWYQLATEDGDPLLLALNLIAAIRLQVSGFEPLKLESRLQHGELSPDNVDQIASLLLEELKKTELICVFDDVHHLAGFSQSEKLLALFLQGASASLRFILLSRQTLPQVIKTALPKNRTLRLSNAELAFNHHEIAELFNTIISRPLTLGAVSELHRLTEGWSMGLRLLGLGLPEENAASRQERLTALSLKGHSILDYFMREVFSTFSLVTRETLLKLSLLERIPLALAKKLLDAEPATIDLNALFTDNLFIRSHEGETDVFVFHHLFREALKNLAGLQLSPETINAVQVAAAIWHHESGQYEEALHYYLAADEFEKAEETLKEIGFELMASNRLVTLANFLSEVSADVVENYPWFVYFRGLIHLNTAPPLALSEFEQACRKFEQRENTIGEFLCLIESVAFHVLVDGAFNTARPLLDRAEKLYPDAAAHLHPRYHLHTASNLALAAIFINCDFIKARHYNEISTHLADQAGTANAQAVSLIAKLAATVFAFDFSGCALLAEQAARVVRAPNLSPYLNMVLRVMLCDYLYLSGQFDSYQRHAQVVRDAANANLALRSVAGPMMRMWDIDIAFSSGDTLKARQLLADALQAKDQELTVHMRSQYLAYQALVDASEGRIEALSMAGEALQLREQAGGVYHTNECLVAYSAVHTLLGKTPRASELLSQSQQLTEDKDQGFLLLPALALQAWLANENGDSATADGKIAEFMAQLKRYVSKHFYFFHPKIIRAVLSRAVRIGCEVELARRFAASRLNEAIDDDGTCVPLLRIQTLGELRLELGAVVLSSRDIGPQHRMLLAMLVSSSKHKIHTHRLQCEFWPESSEKKARSKFDVMLLRLRRLFEETFGVNTGKRYLLQKNGVLSLANCQLDSHLFRQRAENGLKYLARGEGWRAVNEFHRATLLWDGVFLDHETTTHEIEAIREGLLVIFRRMTTAWGKLHLAWEETDVAVAIAERAFNMVPTDDELAKLLYQSCILNEEPRNAQKVLTTFHSALLNNGYDHVEADEALQGFWEG